MQVHPDITAVFCCKQHGEGEEEQRKIWQPKTGGFTLNYKQVCLRDILLGFISMRPEAAEILRLSLRVVVLRQLGMVLVRERYTSPTCLPSSMRHLPALKQYTPTGKLLATQKEVIHLTTLSRCRHRKRTQAQGLLAP